jgi:hypothetical protein
MATVSPFEVPTSPSPTLKLDLPFIIPTNQWTLPQGYHASIGKDLDIPPEHLNSKSVACWQTVEG